MKLIGFGFCQDFNINVVNRHNAMPKKREKKVGNGQNIFYLDFLDVGHFVLVSS